MSKFSLDTDGVTTRMILLTSADNFTAWERSLKQRLLSKRALAFLKSSLSEAQQKAIALIVAEGASPTPAEALKVLQAKAFVADRNGIAFSVLTNSLSDTVTEAIPHSLTNYEEPDCRALCEHIRTQYGYHNNQRQAEMWQDIWGTMVSSGQDPIAPCSKILSSIEIIQATLLASPEVTSTSIPIPVYKSFMASMASFAVINALPIGYRHMTSTVLARQDLSPTMVMQAICDELRLQTKTDSAAALLAATKIS